jgi:hypothetical protein
VAESRTEGEAFGAVFRLRDHKVARVSLEHPAETTARQPLPVRLLGDGVREVGSRFCFRRSNRRRTQQRGKDNKTQ